jgi:hypothetical protein
MIIGIKKKERTISEEMSAGSRSMTFLLFISSPIVQEIVYDVLI